VALTPYDLVEIARRPDAAFWLSDGCRNLRKYSAAGAKVTV